MNRLHFSQGTFEKKKKEKLNTETKNKILSCKKGTYVEKLIS